MGAYSIVLYSQSFISNKTSYYILVIIVELPCAELGFTKVIKIGPVIQPDEAVVQGSTGVGPLIIK